MGLLYYQLKWIKLSTRVTAFPLHYEIAFHTKNSVQGIDDKFVLKVLEELKEPIIDTGKHPNIASVNYVSSVT